VRALCQCPGGEESLTEKYFRNITSVKENIKKAKHRIVSVSRIRKVSVASNIYCLELRWKLYAAIHFH
jgi:hypothetical protein